MANKTHSLLNSSEIKIYNKLIGCLIKNGLKFNAIKVLNSSLFIVSKKTGYSFSYLVFQIFRKAFTRVEVRNVIIKGKAFIVPFTISTSRRFFLVTKWLLQSLNALKKKKSLRQIIVEELMLLLLNKKSKILDYKEKNYKSALANKSNLHYRW